MVNQILYQGADFKVVQSPDGVRIYRQPWGLLVLVGVFALSSGGVRWWTGTFDGIAGAIGALAGLLLSAGVVNWMIPSRRIESFFGAGDVEMRVREKLYPHILFQEIAMEPSGAGFISLLLRLTDGTSLRLLTVSNAKKGDLEKVSEAILEAVRPPTPSVKAAQAPESSGKLLLAFYGAFTVLWVALGLVFFTDVRIVSIHDAQTSIPAWSAGLLVPFIALGALRKRR